MSDQDWVLFDEQGRTDAFCIGGRTCHVYYCKDDYRIVVEVDSEEEAPEDALVLAPGVRELLEADLECAEEWEPWWCEHCKCYLAESNFSGDSRNETVDEEGISWLCPHYYWHDNAGAWLEKEEG